jgi:single-strand DNA-binding protein
MGTNTFHGSGFICKDAETGNTAKGTAVCRMTVAVDSGFGESKKANFVEVSLFGKRAEGGLVQYLRKGQFIMFSGELSLDEWEHEGKKYSRLKVLADKIDLPPKPKTESQPEQSNGFVDSDIPF